MDAEMVSQAKDWADLVLRWIGFGTVVGLAAKAIMPGRDPGGAVATLAMGIGGTVIGCGVFTYIRREGVEPLSPIGFAVGTGGAFLILFFYRLLGGQFFEEGDRSSPRLRSTRRRRRRFETATFDE